MSSLAEARARLVCQLSVHHHSSKGAVQRIDSARTAQIMQPNLESY